MDLSWCIICDNRIDDNVMSDSSLYCSNSCRVSDQSQHQAQAASSPPATNSFTSFLKVQSPKPIIKTGSLRSKRPTAPSNAYPWIPLYRRRHGVLVARRCQPVVSSSPTVATALLTRQPSLIV
ncbi:uncharacterized protein BYT42DRAFT_499104 [Radiomyces spectabilis]|uniref:uncharacterized protein n=1 Tax=Radiomyces spectabilis TaxID=64574 RepID=UPI00222086F5|nr:uncharacterized protein BYT42DRAFT_499104 [Radiomyces spectabilis]KAI8374629.1 hypothetical protein BYT42DRAFT_499104 [Radiomyces spectabilis]